MPFAGPILLRHLTPEPVYASPETTGAWTERGRMRVEQKVEPLAVDEMPDWLREVVEGVVDGAGEPRRVKVRRISGSSNELLELRFGPDRVLMVKRGRHDWVQRMFDRAEVASELLHGRTSLAAPRPLPLNHSSSEPLQAYWRVPLATLGDLWPSLDAPAREEALRDLGRLLRRVHQVRLPGWGDLLDPQTNGDGLERYLHRDLAGRLLPAVRGGWDAAEPALERLIEAIPAVAERVGASRGTLSHGDLHIHNVLCRGGEDAVSCVGFLDLDNARALPPEADLASFEVLHGPLFTQHLCDSERAAVAGGYDDPVDPVLLRFFRASHLCNLGFHSALVGDDFHAERVAEAFAGAVAGILP